MNTLNMPGFTAETSLYKTRGRYHIAVSDAIYSNSVISQLHPPPGLCAKASRFCRDPGQGGQWCDILDRCFDDSGCSPGLSLCGTMCKDLTTDPSNCGACGTSCGPGSVCCGGTCSNLSNDRMNCGACGVSCSSGCCYNGSCGVSTICPISGPSCCPSGFPVCRSFFGNEFCSPF